MKLGKALMKFQALLSINCNYFLKKFTCLESYRKTGASEIQKHIVRGLLCINIKVLYKKYTLFTILNEIFLYFQ